MWGYGGYGAWGVVMGLLMILVWAGIAALIWTALRPNRVAPSGARRILDERLARGEIDPAEYRQRLEALDTEIRP